MDFQDLRKEYASKELRSKELSKNPFDQFQIWLKTAISENLIEPNAMTLATVSAEGRPCCRTVLMKGFDETGLVFFTNLNSRKAHQLASNPYVGVSFLWKELERQVLIEGKVSKITPEESATYFAKRPRGSQLSAWTSPQSEVISFRQVLEDKYQELEQQFLDKEIPLPPFWGGFRIHPTRFEFWQGRRDRLHDRFWYELENGSWNISRLAP